MSEFNASRRDVLKSTVIGLLGLAGLSTTTAPAAGHESIEPSATDLLETIQVPASSEDGFNYPYYLYVPESGQTEPVPMLVEPNNTGTATDDFEEHRTVAEKFSRGQFGWTRKFSEALTAPLLIPVFPRPRSEPVDGNHYVHALDETTMNLDSGELHRVDLQLINMIEHAQELLRDMSYPVADEVMLNGFSASGNFVNRFTGLQPDIVRSVTAGGVNGTLFLPLEQAKGHTLNYHIGVADLDEITGDGFDADSWRDVPQFIYMGGEDENDTIPYSDAWSEEQRQIALDVYGEHMQNDRMPYCESVYDDADADAEIKIYEGVGHRIPKQIQEDIVGFHRKEAELKEISFTEPPIAGETTLEVHVAIFDDQTEFDLRAFSDDRGDLTETATTVSTGNSVDTTIDLTTQVEPEEPLSAIVVQPGTTSPEEAIASVTQQASDPPSMQVTKQPTVTDQTVTINYTVSGRYETDSPVHVYLSLMDGGPKQFLNSFDPGATVEDTYEIDPAELDTAIEVGTQLQAELIDIDSNNQLAAAPVVVGEENQTEPNAPADITFETQPTEGQDEIEVSYSVDDTYEPKTFLTLQFSIRDDNDVLLGGIEPGEDVTKTVSLEKIPAKAGDRIEVQVVDQRPIGSDQTVVVRDTDDSVTLQFTNQPTESDPTATVQYQIDEEYQVQDVLTLRAYTDELPGIVPGDPLALLTVGDADTKTFTVGEDVEPASEKLTVAIMDDEPLVLAATANAEGGFDILDPHASELDISVEPTGSFDVDVSVANPGPTASTETVQLLIGDQRIKQQELQLDAGEQSQISFGEYVPVELGFDSGTHPLVVTTNSDQVSGQLSVSGDGFAILNPSPEFSLSVGRADDFEVDVSVANPDASASSGTVRFLVDEQELNQRNIQLDANEERDLSFGTYIPDELGLEIGTYTAQVITGDTTVGGQLMVIPPQIVGETPPKDLNGDGLYEDINGDGEFTIGDIQMFFQQRDADEVQTNADLFNFSGNDPDEVTISDVQALFQLFQNQG